MLLYTYPILLSILYHLAYSASLLPSSIPFYSSHQHRHTLCCNKSIPCIFVNTPHTCPRLRTINNTTSDNDLNLTHILLTIVNIFHDLFNTVVNSLLRRIAEERIASFKISDDPPSSAKTRISSMRLCILSIYSAAPERCATFAQAA
jgi:hypothetical protein